MGFPPFAAMRRSIPTPKEPAKIDGSNVESEGVFVNEAIKMIQCRRFQFECFYLQGCMMSSLCRDVLRRWFGLWVPIMAFCCRSYSLNDGISTGALREYARVMARLLCPRFTWAYRSG